MRLLKNAEAMETTLTYKLALLHLIHVLVNADGVVDERERQLLETIRKEENITDAVYHAFEMRITSSATKDVYGHGMRLLEECTDEEKLQVFAHLYRMAVADDDMNMREVRLLFYALNNSKIDFDDVVLVARMAS
ncbi:MAG: TerB family tellurite resistance protein [Cyclobacteriaceae bacterium]|nr:TerB family tellurite resistance protein [Cyclobacteriaceae bacterium]